MTTNSYAPEVEFGLEVEPVYLKDLAKQLGELMVHQKMGIFGLDFALNSEGVETSKEPMELEELPIDEFGLSLQMDALNSLSFENE